MASVRCISPRLCGLWRAVAALLCHILRCLVATRSERLPELAPHETLGASPPQWERITRFASSVAQTSNATTTMGVLALFGWASRCPPSAIQSAGEQPSNDSTDSTSSPGSQALLRDPYLSLKAPPLSSYSLVVLPEKPVNGGLWYARASGRGRGAHWVMEEAMPAG